MMRSNAYLRIETMSAEVLKFPSPKNSRHPSDVLIKQAHIYALLSGIFAESGLLDEAMDAIEIGRAISVLAAKLKQNPKG